MRLPCDDGRWRVALDGAANRGEATDWADETRAGSRSGPGLQVFVEHYHGSGNDGMFSIHREDFD